MEELALGGEVRYGHKETGLEPPRRKATSERWQGSRAHSSVTANETGKASWPQSRRGRGVSLRIVNRKRHVWSWNLERLIRGSMNNAPMGETGIRWNFTWTAQTRKNKAVHFELLGEEALFQRAFML